MLCGKTVWKGLFSHGFYICTMHFNRAAVSETEFQRYEYCNDIYSGSFAYFNCDRRLSLQCSRIFLKCIPVLFFSDRTKNVFSDLCGGISGDLFYNAYFIRTYGGTCGKAENTCKALCTACLSHTGSVWYRPSAAEGKRRDRDSWCCLYTASPLTKPQYYSVCSKGWSFIRGKAFLRRKRGHRRFFDTGRTADSQMGLWKQAACRCIHTPFSECQMLVPGNPERQQRLRCSRDTDAKRNAGFFWIQHPALCNKWMCACNGKCAKCRGKRENCSFS